MKNDTANWQNLGIAMVVLAILIALVVLLLFGISKAPWQAITILIGTAGVLITVAGNLNIKIREEQRERKVELYDKVMKLFFSSFFAKLFKLEPKNEEDLAKEIAEITPDLILWASDEVLLTYINLKHFSIKEANSNPAKSLNIFGKLLLAMRKDLGHQNSNLTERKILGTFVIDPENLPEQSNGNS